MTFAFFYRASLGGPDERREQKFATLVGESFLNVTHKYFTHTKHQRKWKKIDFPNRKVDLFCLFPSLLGDTMRTVHMQEERP
ncbi:hypothetical protein LH47_02143 [Anoxybacillus thermarum]|uniref:Uncharacterized protein n=1 Tax=Anoxybacillus thermarum TaxID=404937 RepID=A0A0D0RWR5_9BACL|nr:hypothetical protein LH47_02143 [Anoxybacillus thermarum]